MGLLADHQIRELALCNGMIDPFVEGQCVPGKISFGNSSFGYDIRLGRKFKVLDKQWKAANYIHDVSGFLYLSEVRQQELLIDPKSDKWHSNFTTYTDVDSVMIPPNSFALAESLEVLSIPRDILAVCLGKSTWARCGVICNVTPLEPMWTGIITIEISNSTPLPVKISSGDGICQVLFFRGDAECERSYADKRNGGPSKYQGQTGLTLPKV